MATDDERLRRIMKEILSGQPDAFVVGYLRPDGVTQLCLGGGLQKFDQQAMAHKILFAYALRNAAHEFTDGDEAEFVADGLRFLDEDDAMLQEAVEAGMIPEDALSRYQGGPEDTPADLLSEMVADGLDVDDPDGGCPFCGGGHVGAFCPKNPSNQRPDDEDGDDDEDGEPGGTNIPIN